VPWKEHSGEGISVTTGFHAAGHIMAGAGAVRAAA
jgi:anaerobic glycerol-3-phosphate dehydrogenase